MKLIMTKNELKKISLGLLYGFLPEIIFFFICSISVWMIWNGFVHHFQLNDAQHNYLYSPYEAKTGFIVLFGRKLTVKTWKRIRRKK